MITPVFRLEQDDSFIYIFIKAPYAKLNELDIFVEDNDFRFYCKPYYLRLNLPGSILENSDNFDYDFDQRQFKFKYEKANKGENFDGLDLLTKLLTAPTNKKTSLLIEEISNEGENEEDKNEEDEDDEDKIEWYFEQKLNLNEEIEISSVKYGFAQTKHSVFSKLGSEYAHIIDLEEPDKSTLSERTQLRIQSENEKFDDEHYLADYFDEDEIITNSLLKYRPDYYDQDELEYTQKEFDCLKSLPKKTYLLDSQEQFHAFSGLVDILYAYCYNDRINLGEENVESGWTISKLSSTLSFLDTFKSLEDIVIASFRRSLCIPLYRNLKLSHKVFKDLIRLLKKGRKLIIKKLLSIRQIFIDEENRYIFNDLYINDYCVWIQYVSEKKITKLAECLEKIKITKEMLGFDLECIEIAGKLAVEDPNDQEEETNVPEEADKPSEEDENNQVSSEIIITSDNLDQDGKKTKPKIIELN